MKTPSSSGRQPKSSKAGGPRSAREFLWAKEEDALLRKFTKREAAEKFGRALSAVQDRHTFLGRQP